MLRLVLCAIAAVLPSWPTEAQPDRTAIPIVAAENFYGDVARQVAGADAAVTSVLNNPNQDPHLFEASPSVARDVSTAAIVVYNGADYDPWMPRLLAASHAADRKVIVVADLVHKKAGDNPHLWYEPTTMPAYARALAAALAERDPGRKAEYDQRLQAFLVSLRPLEAKVSELRGRYAGIPVTATEPVFGPMSAALGFTVRNERFQLAVMNSAEPRASDVVAFESDLRQHAVRLLLYNSQATDTSARRLVRLAEQVRIPVVGITETEPPGKNYQAWILDELGAIDQALSDARP